jgi:hypothetical protein
MRCVSGLLSLLSCSSISFLAGLLTLGIGFIVNRDGSIRCATRHMLEVSRVPMLYSSKDFDHI